MRRRYFTFTKTLRTTLVAAVLALAGGTTTAQVTVHGSVYGGGNEAAVLTNTKVNISAGTVMTNVYGGGNVGDVGNITKSADYNYTWKQTDGTTTNTHYNNDITENNTNTGVCTVIISGGTIGSKTAGTGNVFGAGRGKDDTWWCEKAIVFATDVSVTAGTVKGNVYGGGEVGRVEDDTKVTIGAPSGTETLEIKGSAFGAGAGKKTHGYSALVRGNADVTVQGKAKVGGNVYGGGEIASVGRFKVIGGLPSKPQSGGTCKVAVKDQAEITGSVFGACKGVESEYVQSDYKTFCSMQTYTNGTKDKNNNPLAEDTYWNYYETDHTYIWRYYPTEAEYLEFLKTLALTSNTEVAIAGSSTIDGSVYGGGELGVTLGNSTVDMLGGTVSHHVFGGGSLADTNTAMWDADNNRLYDYVELDLINGLSHVTGYYEKSGGNYTLTSAVTAQSGHTYYAIFKTKVNLLGGTILGDAYGGGLGRLSKAPVDAQGTEGQEDYVPAQAAVTAIEAKVYGDVKVNLNGMTVGEYATASASNKAVLANSATNGNGDNDTTDADEDYHLVSSKGCIVNRVFGCNDLNGSPQDNVTVHVFATQNTSKEVVGDKFINDNLDLTKGASETDAAYLARLKGIHAKEIALATALSIITDSYQVGETATASEVKTAIEGITGAINAKTTAEINAVKYDLKAVYGGGNEAAYNPITPYHPTTAATGSKVQVIIDGCDYTSIETVYGGGNAAPVPEANVTVNAAYEIETVFGGGNGRDNKESDGSINEGADIGTLDQGSTTYGTGNANTLISGGYIHEAYGGSNERGTIMGTVNLRAQAGTACDMLVKKMVTAGKNADIMGDAITVLGCMPDTWVDEYYGGADNANVHGDVELTITSGKFRKVFGGNNTSGIIMGHLKVNIEETGCRPIEIDELYLGGNKAAYSYYGYYVVPQTDEQGNIVYDENNKPKPLLTEVGKLTFAPRESATDSHKAVKRMFRGATYEEYSGAEGDTFSHYDAQPELNVISCTRIGQVFGGGLGEAAKMYADPKVNINMIAGAFATSMTTNTTDNPNKLGEIGTVYGGGNAADVIGNPTVNIGTASTVDLVSTGATGNAVLGAYITGNVYGGGKGEADDFFCDKAMIGKDGDGVANPTGGTTVYIYNGTVRGNVYGGGQIGRVEKNTVVTIGNGDGVPSGGTVTSAPIIMGSVYGGGAGEEEHGYAALVRGNPTVTIQGNAKVRHSVYGGGEIASVARYNVPKTETEVQQAIAAGYTEAKLGMPYALKDPNSGTCTVIVRGYAEIGPATEMQMTKTGGPDDTGYVFGAGKGILPGGEYEFASGTTRRMVLYDANDHKEADQGTKWQWVDYPNHSESNNNVWEYFADLDEYITFIQTLALSSRTDVTITGNAFVKGSVYGGSENGIVQFDTDVKIQGGQIGWGSGETGAHPDTYWTTNSEDPTKFAECPSWTFQSPYAPYDPYATTLYNGKYYYDTNHTQEAAGGAVVATDGHTFYGNVFGGGSGSVPYFDHALGRSVYLHSAGQVKGDTYVTISGGHILTNVYGGCEATNVNGTANVTMTGGTVGVPRTDDDIIAHPLTGYIFGGGKGDQRIFFNKDTNVKDAVVTIEGGRVYGSVYGGGEDGHVMRNVTLTIGKQTTTGEGTQAVTTTSGPKIGTKGTSYYDGHVFGGGRGFGGEALTAGNVGGSVDMDILGGDILGSVYGGGRLASVGYGLYLVDEEVTIDGSTVKPYGTMRPDNLYDDPSKPISTTETAAQFFTKGRGHVDITISGGTIGNDDEYAYDASNPITHTKGGNVFAGGMGRMYILGSTTTPISSLDWWKLGNVKSTKLTITGGEIKSCVYGGGELGMVQGGSHTSASSKTVSTEITINGGTIGTEVKDGSNVVQYTFGSVFGGGYGSLTEKLEHTGSTNPTYSTYKYTYPKYIAGRVKGSTEVTMTSGTVRASVYGGGEMAAVGESKVLSTSTDPKILGETLTGSNGAPIEANTYVTISGGTIGKAKDTAHNISYGGAKMGNVYGGGSGHNNTVRSGHIYGNTNVTISGASTRIYHNVYGGGAYGTVGDFEYNTKDEEVTVNNETVTTKKVSGVKELKTAGTGVATITITGGTIGIDGKENGMVFGSSRGDINKPGERDDYTAWVYDTYVTIGTAGTPAQGNEGEEGYVPATSASGPDIMGSVYGSGENGHTFNNTVVTMNGGTIGIASGSAVTSNGTSYAGAAYPYRGNVYGGGCGTDMYDSDDDGTEDSFNALAGIVYGTTTINITGGTVVRNVYGAGAMGSVGKTATTTTEGVTTTTTTGGVTTINISGGQIGVDGTAGDGCVFGAARGNADAISNETALVRKETNVTVSGGEVKGNVYGGGEMGCVGVYTITNQMNTFTWQNTDGSDNTAANTDKKNTGICNVTISGGTVGPDNNTNPKIGNVFGAGKGEDDTFWCEKGIAYKTVVHVSNGTVNGNVYGGGEVGRVETDTEVKVGIAPEEGGAESKPTINGSVFGGGAGLETHGYSALVRGNTTVTIDQKATVEHSVYGGGEIASVGKYGLDTSDMPSILKGGGYCYVTVKGNATIAEDVFGAGKGVTPHFNNTVGAEDRSKRMILATALKEGDVSEPYETGSPFVWHYLQTQESYSTYLETLALVTHPEVTIDGSASVGKSVYGGGELGITKGSVIVNIEGGTITEDVYGGGSLANTNIATKADLDGDGNEEDVVPTTTVNLKSGTINRNVYGGGLGRLASNTETAVEAKVYGTVLVELNKPVTKTTGEGQSATTTTTYGDCVVKGTIFGCNNLNGSPQKNATVHIYKTLTKSEGTEQAKPDKNTEIYELEAVYGGGNLAAFYPDDATARATAKACVIIDGCDLTSIKSVYGGGNAASTPATEVTVNGTYEIGSVFGGGNGKDDVSYDGGTTYVPNPGANVGYKNYSEHYQEGGVWKVRDMEAYDTKEEREASTGTNGIVYGTGKTQVSIYGGTIHAVYGGSNTKGNVRIASVALLDGETIAEGDEGYCAFDVDEAYGGGKNADMDGTATLIMSCIQGMKQVYGGAEDADVLDNVVLNITNGTFDQVFGGNNKGGRVAGSITVNIDETGCKPVIIGELYGGGNMAAYSKYGYYQEGGEWKYRTEAMYNAMTPAEREAERLPYADPQVNAKSFTGIGNIFGGGYGAGAVMVANPTVNINVVKGRYSEQTSAERFTTKGYTLENDPNNQGKERYKKTIGGSTVYVPAHEVGTIGALYNVFGGGNAAAVIGNPTVNVGTEAGEEAYTIAVVATDADVTGYYTQSYTAATGTAVAGTTYYLKTTENEKDVYTAAVVATGADVAGYYTQSYTAATGTAVSGTTYYQKSVKGADIRGNVYGGGNKAEVHGNPTVNIGKKKE